MSTEIFSGIEAPSVLNRERLSYLSRNDYERLSFPELERIKLEKIVQVLDHPELKKLVQEGKVTLAMIKPQASENKLGLDDLSMARRIEREIKKPLKPVFSIAIRFNENDVEEFYAGQPKALQISLPPNRNMVYPNRWEEFKSYMTGGPTTFLLLYADRGNAVKEWRRQIGHWDVENRREPRTIRGKYAKSNYTSIVHGSDKTETVLREIGVLRNHLARLVSRSGFLIP